MKTVLVSIVILLMGCSNKESSEWSTLTDKYFEYDKKGLYDSARIIGEKALETAIADFEPNDIRIAQSSNNVGEMYRELGQFKKSISFYEKAIEIATTNSDSLNNITFITNLGILYFDNGNIDLAEQKFKTSIHFIERLKSQKDEDLITPLNTLGLIEIDRDNHHQARQYLNRAFECLIQNPNDIYYAILYENMGQLFIKEKNDSALYFLTKSQQIKQKYYGTNHPSIGGLYGLLGVYYHVNQDYDSALKYYNKAIDSRPGAMGKTNPKLILTLRNLSRLYFDMGDSTKGKEIQLKADEFKVGK